MFKNRSTVSAALFLAALASACSSPASEDANSAADDLTKARSIAPDVTVTATPVNTLAHAVTAAASTTTAAGAHGDIQVGVCAVKDENEVPQDTTGPDGSLVRLPLNASSVTFTNPLDADLVLRFSSTPATFSSVDNRVHNNFPINIAKELQVTKDGEVVAKLRAHGAIALNVGAHVQSSGFASIRMNCAPLSSTNFHYSGGIAYDVGAEDLLSKIDSCQSKCTQAKDAGCPTTPKNCPSLCQSAGGSKLDSFATCTNKAARLSGPVCDTTKDCFVGLATR